MLKFQWCRKNQAIDPGLLDEVSVFIRDANGGSVRRPNNMNMHIAWNCNSIIENLRRTTYSNYQTEGNED